MISARLVCGSGHRWSWTASGGVGTWLRDRLAMYQRAYQSLSGRSFFRAYNEASQLLLAQNAVTCTRRDLTRFGNKLRDELLINN